MLNAHLAEAHIKLISKKQVAKKLDFATIGGFSVQPETSEKPPVDLLDAASRQSIEFDWVQNDGNSFETLNGHMGIDWTLSHFDSEHFAGNDDLDDTPDWEQIAASILTEVHYENGYVDPVTNEEIHVPMVLSKFKIVVYNHDYSESQTYEFSPSQIAEFNKRTNAVPA